MPKIFLCVDPGGSQTKIIYQLPKEQKPRYLLMSPFVEEIKENNLKRYLEKESKMSNPSPIRQAYLKVNKRTFVVGYFASKFDPEDRLSEIKYENALYKTLAAVGVIAEQNNLNLKKISLQLAVLLPWNEYEDRQKFYKKLKEYLIDFVFRASTYSVELDKFICRPEGGGLAAIYTRKKGSSWQQNKKLGILMFGHRNITALNFEYGDLTGDSPLIGFSRFLDNVLERTSGLDRARIASAIFKGLESTKSKRYESPRSASHTFYPEWSKLDEIDQLANAKDSDLRQIEMKDVCQAIEIATEEYWITVSKWLAKVFPTNLDSVVISGGASRFLKPDLEKYFNCQHIYEKDESSYYRPYSRTGKYQPLKANQHFTPMVWGAGLTKEIEEILALEGEEEAENSLSYRLVDAYGLFDLLISKNLKRVKKASRQSMKQGGIAS
ncbi:MAG: ParM/StbA family protein [Pleurocapsa sp. MO_192.B19]|nr:ParM/StbA family protein [Pleurocapsa sp. MO_192.B19]